MARWSPYGLPPVWRGGSNGISSAHSSSDRLCLYWTMASLPGTLKAQPCSYPHAFPDTA